MNRNDFLKKGLLGIGTLVAVPTVVQACSKNSNPKDDEEVTEDCELSPSETAGPFPIKTPADLMRANIVSDRTGVALLITFKVLDQSEDCKPLSGAFVDVWHCDAEGYYSEYGGIALQPTDLTSVHFLRGRQTTDANGNASFISIFPGWYNGRAPHIHLEVLDSSEKSIRTTQIAFPKSVCDTVYSSSNYKGEADTLNSSDNVFSNSIEGNMADSVTGNTADGYTLLKTIVV
ncbi:intradiol ring-cleavage dioxygenase [Arenibacter sp. TNZ]|jgi:protocatechuate 3,4-dioxygenase beta subunit|uniref:dioxygenase family protein n=1 Tax=Arenibacter TaxID=178469 RepID=UPI000CD4232F|nr:MULTISPECIES: intradiol ring-cleavage dioxygenase [Arenibacter]MCM4173219.1 intradiol ring-cleavage dioxygenase [Arenibacter sp. TNZ]